MSEGRKIYITSAGYKALKAELKHLWEVERPKVTREVSDAAALGDRSENAEYIYGKKRLREIDRRMRYLSKRIDDLEVVTPSVAQAGRVFFGAHVTVEDDDGESLSFQIVGPDEIEAGTDVSRITINSPMAKALLGKSLDDEVIVTRPKGTKSYVIIDIGYDI